MDDSILEATRLWTAAVPTVSAFVTSLVRGFQDRDDVLQETSVAVMSSFARYDPSRPFVGWALGIARNQVRLHFRRKGRDGPTVELDAADALADAFAGDSDADRRLDRLAECVEALDDKARDLCRWRYESDLKPAEIAARLGMAANTIAKALQRIRDRLRDCIERKVTAEGSP